MKYYVQDSRQVVGNSLLWWRKGGGYTCDLKTAELFNKVDALKICNNRASDIMWKRDEIDPLIQHHIDMQGLR